MRREARFLRRPPVAVDGTVVAGMPVEVLMLFRQLFDKEASTYTYLVADEVTKEAALIDPVLEQLERDLEIVRELGLTLVRVLDTHVHADHVTAAGRLCERSGALTVGGQGGAPRTVSTIGEEKRFNRRVAGRTREEFVAVMDGLHLPEPARLREAVPANRACGIVPRRCRDEREKGEER